jgi:diaminopimelate epimerase
VHGRDRGYAVTDRLLKVDGAGNDFVVGTGAWATRLTDEPSLVRRLCHRRRGIGADGALAVSVAGPAAVMLYYRNRDGSEAAFCANATRCAARVAVQVLGLEPVLEVTTGWARIPAEVHGSEVTLDLPSPPASAQRLDLEASGRTWKVWYLEVGVPHVVIPVEDVEALDLCRVGPELRRHVSLGAEGANVNFVADEPAGGVVVRTWERGVEAETLACGSGIVAVALVQMASRGKDVLRCRARSGDVITVEACASPPRCASRLTGPTRILAELRPTEELTGEGSGPGADNGPD